MKVFKKVEVEWSHVIGEFLYVIRNVGSNPVRYELSRKPTTYPKSNPPVGQLLVSDLTAAQVRDLGEFLQTVAMDTSVEDA